MNDEERQRYANLPIPTYEEAISSRPSSAQTSRGPAEISDDAERQGLLHDNRYHAPTVESARSSEDSDLRLPEVVLDDSRRQIEELDYLDPSDDDPSSRRRGIYHRARLRRQFSKHLANLSATFSSLRLPSFRSFYTPVHTDDDDGTPDPPRAQQPPSRFEALRRWRQGFSIPEQYRMSAPIFARLCGLFTIAAVVYVLFALDLFPGTRPRMGAHYDPEAVRLFVQDGIDAASIEEYLHHITSYDHVAGTEGDFYLASWMQEQWLEQGGFDKLALLDYYAYLNYPTHDGRSVQIVEPEGKRASLQLEENLVDPRKQQSLVWHGHSFSGEARGHLVYANGGSRGDFEWLKSQGVETEGAIALVRYYATQADAALKIKAAEEAGCVGVLMYSDPSDDGSAKGQVWPEGPWRPDDSVQRGGVGRTSWIIGDPLTPGWASTLNADTISKASSPALPKIPSLPLSWRAAQTLIEALKGQGVEVPQAWTGGTGNKGKWFTGRKDGKNAPIVELRNHNDENEKQQIWNLHGVIQGMEQPKEKVIIGNHRDSWCFGSVDPGSGSAVMMEVVSIFMRLRTAGWRPLRSIEFVSWDAKEYNLIGSTEYVEDNIDYLREHGVAYLNVGAGVWGNELRVQGSPLFQKPLLHVLGRVGDPSRNSTLKQLWNANSANKLDGLDTEGDYAAFQSLAGTASLDFAFEGDAHAFPYHSCYDTFDWTNKFGDPGFEYHKALAQVWALLILEIADRPLIPFDLRAYAKQIKQYVKALEKDVQHYHSEGATALDMGRLRDAAQNLTQHVKTFHKFEDTWTSNVLGAGGLESNQFAFQRLDYNTKIARFESDLLDLPAKGEGGIPRRPQFKHVVFGPREWGREAVPFPGVRDALEIEDWEVARELVERASEVLERAGRRLVE